MRQQLCRESDLEKFDYGIDVVAHESSRPSFGKGTSGSSNRDAFSNHLAELVDLGTLDLYVARTSGYSVAGLEVAGSISAIDIVHVVLSRSPTSI